MKEEKVLTNRQEKLLKTVIVKILTDKAQGHLNDKAVVKLFPQITDITDEIIVAFYEMNLMDIANQEIRKDFDDEKFPKKCNDCC